MAMLTYQLEPLKNQSIEAVKPEVMHTVVNPWEMAAELHEALGE